MTVNDAPINVTGIAATAVPDLESAASINKHLLEMAILTSLMLLFNEFTIGLVQMKWMIVTSCLLKANPVTTVHC